MASAERAQFDEKGYTLFRGVLDPALVAEADAHVDWLLEKNPGLRPEQLGHQLAQHDAFWVRLISDPRLLDVAEQFIGPDIALFATHYICKPPRDGEAVLWHQDGQYWPLDPPEVVTLWLAVSESTPANGCMRVIPGTQNLEYQPHHQQTDSPNVLGSGMDKSAVDEGQAVDLVLDPGDVSVHHPNVVHGSNANLSDRWRKGLTIRYIPTSTRILTEDGKPWPSAFLLRGKAVPRVNEYNPLPPYHPGTSMPFRGMDAWPPR
jgi:phytanoyl-CoA hydroxylase